MLRASLRWMPGLSGFGSGPTALTNARRPPASRSRAATPGENPPGWVTASTTLAPSRRSTSSRSQAGASAQPSRCPTAGGPIPEPMTSLPWSVPPPRTLCRQHPSAPRTLPSSRVYWPPFCQSFGRSPGLPGRQSHPGYLSRAWRSVHRSQPGGTCAQHPRDRRAHQGADQRRRGARRAPPGDRPHGQAAVPGGPGARVPQGQGTPAGDRGPHRPRRPDRRGHRAGGGARVLRQGD